MAGIERRYTDSDVEVRAGPGKALTIGGYAAVFVPAESRNLGGFIERVSPFCVDEVRSAGWKNPDGSGVACRYNHDSNMLLGTSEAGTLRLSTDTRGIEYTVSCPQTRRDVFELVERGDIRFSSFAFRVTPGGDDWGVDRRAIPIRTLNSVELIDVAPVLTPGYPDSSVGLRSLEAARAAGRVPAPRRTDAQRLVEARAAGSLAHQRVIELEHRMHEAQLAEHDPSGGRRLNGRVALLLAERRFRDAP